LLRLVSQEAWRVLSQRRGVWWLLLWLGVVTVLVVVVMVGTVAGLNGALSPNAGGMPLGRPSSVIVPLSGGVSPWDVVSSSMLLDLAGGLAFVVGVAAPFTAGGFYGVLTYAMASRTPIGARAFWREGWRNWGRGYGVLLMTVLVGMTASIATGILLAVLHLLGPLGRVIGASGTGAIVLGSLLWIYWSTAHLFRGHWTWRRAMGEGLLDAWRFKWPSLGVLLAVGSVGAATDAVAAALTRWIAPVGALAASTLSGGVLLFSATVVLGWHDYGERQSRPR